MKCTFLIPPCFDHKQPAERSAGCTRVVYPMPNIYELTVAASVRHWGAEVSYRDFAYNNNDKEGFLSFCKSDHSDLYLIWAVNLSIESDLQAISILRRSHPDTPVVMMGPGPTFYTRKCLVDKNVYVVRGEPDATLIELLDALKAPAEERPALLAEIRGISYLDADGEVRNNPSRPLITDLDALPFPARDLVDDHEFHNPKLKIGPYTTMFTSRNCPYQCIYCVPSSLSFAREIEFGKDHQGRKPTISFRSPESVEREVAQLAAQGVRAIGFMDDNFIWNEERTAALCAIMRKYDIQWGCEARVDAITPAIAKMLGESNCRYIDLGVESFDPEILKYVKKGITPEDIHRAVALLKEHRVPVKLNILIGSSPLETRETVLHTLREVKRLDVDQVMFNIVSPFPGTKYYQMCKENGWIKGGDYRPTDVQRESILQLPHISAREMEKLLFRNNLSFFLSWRFISKQLWRFRSWKEFSASARALKIKLFG